MAFAVGKWTEVGEKKNFDALMKAFGVEGEMKKAFWDSKETMEYWWDPKTEELTMKETSTMYPGKGSPVVVKHGVQFQDTDLTGGAYKSILTIHADKNELHQEGDNESWGKFHTIRRFEKDTMTTDVTMHGVTMILNFKKM